MQDWSFSDLGGALSSIPDLIREPAANPTAASLLLVIIIVLLLLVVLSALLVLMRPAKDKAAQEDAVSVIPVSAAPAVPRPAPRTFREWLDRSVSWALPAAFVVVLLVVIWIAGGLTTSLDSTCLSCHVNNPHSSAGDIDPHPTVACVRCHEAGGQLARVGANVPARLAHFVNGRIKPEAAADFGIPVSSYNCRVCHKAQLVGVLVNEKQGVKVSHKEPLEAGAECVDCHALESGIVSHQTVGMTPCLRCHDGENAKAGCDVCHVADPAQAIRSTETTTGSLAEEQIEQPMCDGCHDLKAEGCDGCHGIRLPHTTQFMAWGHAREGVIDLWTNQGRMCSKCHNATSRPCTKCHTRFLTHGSNWDVLHGQGAPYSSNCGCHKYKAYDRNRKFCTLCHETKPAGAKP